MRREEAAPTQLEMASAEAAATEDEEEEGMVVPASQDDGRTIVVPCLGLVRPLR